MTDGVPLEISVTIFCREGMNDMGAVIMRPTAAVSICKFPCDVRMDEQFNICNMLSEFHFVKHLLSHT